MTKDVADLPSLPEPDLGSVRLQTGKDQPLGYSDEAMKAFGFQCYARGVMAGKAALEAAASPTPAELIYCEEKKKPGGCQLHNLHCGWPECNKPPQARAKRAAVPASVVPADEQINRLLAWWTTAALMPAMDRDFIRRALAQPNSAGGTEEGKLPMRRTDITRLQVEWAAKNALPMDAELIRELARAAGVPE